MIGTVLDCAQALADLEAVEPRQHDVQHDEIDRRLAEMAQRLFAVGRLDNRVPVLLEREREHLADGVLVVDEQDRGSRFGHRGRRAARIALAMAMARTPARRRRARRGSLERPVNARLYRASLLVLALPLLILAFSVTRPGALPAPLLPPNFDGSVTRQLATDFSTHFPDRAPGGPGSLRAGQWFRDQLAPYGLPVSSDTWVAHVPGLGEVRLRNLWAVARGQSADAIVVMAHRDDIGTGPGANDDASGTAALVELARGYAQAGTPAAERVRSAHTVVFLSTDGGSFGGLGALRFAERAPFHVVATINLAAIGGRGAAADRDHRRHSALAAGEPRRDRRKTRPRADRDESAPGRRRRAADRSRLPAHAVRAGAVRRAWHSRRHAHDRRRSGRRPRSRIARRRSTPRGSPPWAARPRS